MCDFKPGDEVVCVEMPDESEMVGRIFTIIEVRQAGEIGHAWPLAKAAVQLAEAPYVSEYRLWGYGAHRFRKVQKRNDRLTIEAFMTVPGDFEEPKRAPAKKRERVQ